MDTPDDNTAVIRMKRDFEEFIGKSGSSSRQRRAVPSFSYGASFLDSSASGTTPSNSVTMQQIIEKDKEERLKKAELSAARGRIASLETQLGEAETCRKRARIEWERDRRKDQEDSRHSMDRLSELKQQLHLVANKEEEAREELAQYRRKLESTKSTYEQKVRQLQKEKNQLELDFQQVQQTSGSMQTELKSEMMRQTAELQICHLEVEDLQSQLASAHKRCADANMQIAELEENGLKALSAEQKIQDLELQLLRVEEDSTVNKAMRTQLSKMHQLERENKRLIEENMYCKETQENTLLLKEQLDGLQRKLRRSEDRWMEFNTLQIENQELQARLQKWESTEIARSSGGGRVRSPEELGKLVAELQATNALLLEKQGDLQTSLNLTRESQSATDQKQGSRERELLKVKLQGQQHTDLIKRLQRKLLLVTKERDGYKGIITQYESEATISLSSTTSVRTQQLEETVASYQSHLERLEAELQRNTEQLIECKAQAQMADNQMAQLNYQQQLQRRTSLGEVDQKLVTELREKIAGLEKHLEQALDEKDVLEGRMERHNLQGDYDPTKTKVVHLSMNPVALAQQRRAQELEVLKAENERLKQRVAVLEEAEGKVEDLTVRVEEKLQQQPSTSKEVEDMKGQLALAELKNKRLMEAFKKTSHEFRQAVYQLLGYKIDIPCANQYRLMNMYADSPDDFLLFQQAGEGLQMLSTDYSSTLDEKIELYLQTYDSIPAFLSSITLDLHSGQTVLQ